MARQRELKSTSTDLDLTAQPQSRQLSDQVVSFASKFNLLLHRVLVVRYPVFHQSTCDRS
jgi:hypothetical protein